MFIIAHFLQRTTIIIYMVYIIYLYNKTVLFTHCGRFLNKTETKTITLNIEKEELDLLTCMLTNL